MISRQIQIKNQNNKKMSKMKTLEHSKQLKRIKKNQINKKIMVMREKINNVSIFLTIIDS